MYVLTSKFIKKKLEKKLSKQKKKLKAWILLNQTRTEKQTRSAALRHAIYFFEPNELLCYNVLLIPTSSLIM